MKRSVIYDSRVSIGAAAALVLASISVQAQPAATNEAGPSVPQRAADNAAYPSDWGTNCLIDLPTALRLAGARNLDIQLARERLRDAEAEKSSATEKFFPWISPGIGYHRRDGVAQAVPAGTISDAHFQSYSPGASIAAQVEFGDALYKSLEAKQLVKASEHALEAQRQETITTTAQLYFELAKSKALVGVVAEALTTSRDYQQQLHNAVATGLAFKGDELRVETQSKHYEISLRQAVELQQVAAVNLARTLHLDPRVELVPRDAGLERMQLFDTNATVDRLLEQALRERPELKQSEALASAARQTKNGAVYGPLIPTLGAQAFGGGLGGGPDGGPNNFAGEADYLLGLSWRIGPGGLFDSGRVNASKARLATAQLGAAKLKDDIMAQVVAGLARLRSTSDQITLSEANLASASETLRLTRERKQYGVGIVLEDIQAEQELARARVDYVSAIAEHNKAQYGLKRAVGGIDQ